jgi:hypothetical protein
MVSNLFQNKLPGCETFTSAECFAFKAGVQQTGFLQSGFLWFFNTPEILGVGENMVFMGFFNCFNIKQRNVTDSSTACLSVAAGRATWAAGLLAAALAVDLLLNYYLHGAQLGVMGLYIFLYIYYYIVSGESEPAGGVVVDEAVSAPLLPNDANDADKGVVESLHGGAK